MPFTRLQTLKITAQNDILENSQNDTVYAKNSVPFQQANYLSDVLTVIPGVTVGGTSGMDQHIYIRGVDDKSLKVTIDGARQENNFFHHSGNLAIDTDLLKEAEVAVGNNSVTLGNNAQGGAIKMTTIDAEDLLKPEQTLGAKLKTEYYSNDKQKHGAATIFGKPTDNTSFLLYYGQRNSDGGEDAKGNHIQGDDIVIKNILAKFSIEPVLNHKLTASYKRYDNTGNYPFRPEFGYKQGPNAQPGNINPGYNKSDEYNLQYAYTPDSDFNVKANLYHTNRQFMVQGKRGSQIMTLKSKGNIDGLTLQAQNRLQQPFNQNDIQHKFIYGAEAYKKSSENLREGIADNKREQKSTSYGIYVEDQIDFGKLQLVPGIRYDRYDAAKAFHDKGNDTQGRTFDKVSGALAANVRLSDEFNVFASHTQFFNGPPLPETLRNGNTYLPSPGLKPEEGSNTEFGINWAKSDVFTNGDKMNLIAKGFKTNFDNTIDLKNGQPCGLDPQNGCSVYSNTDRAKIDGYEISSHYSLDNVVLRASYAHAKGKKADGSSLRDTGNQLGIGFDYLLDNYSLGMRLNHTASVTRKEFPRGSQKLEDKTYPSYHTVDVYGSYSPKQLSGLKLDAGIYNLTNEYYARHSSRDGDAEAGRNFKLSATYQF